MSDDLKGKVALVTGASRGIGRAISLPLAEAGVRVAVNHRAHDEEALEVVRVIERGGGAAVVARANVAEPDDVASMVAAVEADLGSIDILINNAGIARALPLEQLHLATWDKTFAVNVRAPFIVTSAVLPGMRARQWGRLVFVSSTAAKVGGIVGPHYAASKAALMHGYASQLAKEGITANVVSPALIETPMLAGNIKADPAKIPVGRFGTPEEVADLVLAVTRNGYLTGQTIQVNGGIYMT